MSALAAYACLTGAAYALDANRAVSQYVHESWGTEQGFPKGAVYAIAQTADGYLWIGTEQGLVRFDGWNFRLVNDDSGVFTIARVTGLTADLDGGLWIRSLGTLLLHYRDGVFTLLSPELGDISGMSGTSRGDLLIAKMDKGALAVGSAGMHMLVSAAGLPRSPIISLAQTADGDIWMGSRDAGLWRFSNGKTLPVTHGLPDLKINCLVPGGERDLWVGTDNGIVRWDGTELTGKGIPSLPGRFQALAMVKDRDGNIWTGTDSLGLLRLNSQGFAALSDRDGRSGGAVTALCEDREGNLWIGHGDGIERLRDSAFVTYPLPGAAPAGAGSPVFADSDGRVWFGPATGGLWWLKDQQRGQVPIDGLTRDVVYSIAGKSGELWIGRQHSGLTQLRYEPGSVISKSYTHAEGLAQDSVYSVYMSRDGTVWAGTLSAGISMLKHGRFTTYTVDHGLASNTVASILESSDGTMWFATSGGLSALSESHWHSYTTGDGLPSDNVNCLLEDSAGVLWVGTASGVVFRDRQGFHAPPAGSAAMRGQILGLAEDAYGRLWLATSNRVLRVSREKLLQGSLTAEYMREYGVADGLGGLEGVKRHQSVVTDSEGRIWFSLNRGISMVDPARLTRNYVPVIPQVQSISADGSAIHIGPAVHIPAGSHRIKFGYVGLSLADPDRVRYRYMLAGYDTAWTEPAAIREAGYTNLKPGPYRFRLMASNPDGVWNMKEAAIAFEVDPLFWQTWWFEWSAIAMSVAAIAGVYRFRLRRLTQKLNVRFQERLTERTRIAQELNDTLLQGFLSASMQLHVAADGLPADSQVRPMLTRALELMGRVIDEGRNAIRGLRLPDSASADLGRAFSRIQQELDPQSKEYGKVEFRVVVDGPPRPLHPLLRDEVYRIGREALINAFRHARAHHIEVELQYSPNHLRVFVRDDGLGIDPKILGGGRDGHWGLPGMREGAERIGAQLHIFSSASAGTEVALDIPGSRAFQGQPRRKLPWFGGRH